MIYYTVVTVTSAGYGDFFPHTAPGQLTVVLLFFMLVMIVIQQVGHL